MRIFLDTNVLASALGTRGLCAEVFEAVIDDHVLLTSEAVSSELDRVLAGKFRLPRSTINAYLELLRQQGQVMVPAGAPTRGISDPVDGAVVACAAAAGADVFVTGDQALLDIGKASGMPIKSPRELWMVLAGLKGR